MGFYQEHVLPRLTDRVMRTGELERLRGRVLTGLAGEVVEIGFGSGLNVAHYPRAVTGVLAVEPATVGRKLAAGRVAAAGVPVSYIGTDAQALPLPDGSTDHAVSTWTLCTIPEPGRALAELRRVLRPGGQLHFVEHGLAPDAKVARAQDRYTPLQRRLAGGCHLNRPIDRLLTGAGLELTELSTFYLTGPRAWGYTYLGVATR